jgi:hypothetical protein
MPPHTLRPMGPTEVRFRATESLFVADHCQPTAGLCLGPLILATNGMRGGLLGARADHAGVSSGGGVAWNLAGLRSCRNFAQT